MSSPFFRVNLQSPDIGDIIISMDRIDQEELNVLAGLGTAIWVEVERSERNVLDTVLAASLYGLTPERTLEKACRGLLEKVKGQGVFTAWIQNPTLFNKIFYRLAPEERFVLTAVHLGRWSYDRLMRILDRSREEIQVLLWQARLEMNEGLPYPAGPAFSGPNCPEYNPRMPWTQKFLDEEPIQGKDRHFLTQHMLACSSCAGAMARCRALYFRVNQEVVKNIGTSDFGFSLKKVLEQSPLYRVSSEVSMRESLKIFFQKSDVRLISTLFLGLILFLIIRLAAFTTSV